MSLVRRSATVKRRRKQLPPPGWRCLEDTTKMMERGVWRGLLLELRFFKNAVLWVTCKPPKPS
jgi:hypothetical protein